MMRIFFSSRTSLYQLSPSESTWAAERFCRRALSFCAKGRICCILSCDLRNLAAATIFMALVICWVETTEVILFLTSFKLGIFLLMFFLPQSHEDTKFLMMCK